MKDKQHTLASEINLKGIGLHTGKFVSMKILPAVENHGYVFQRVDMEGKPKINANIEFVTTTERGTTLNKNDVEIQTIEHILAALYGMEIDNALIQLDNVEIPILDGSSKIYVKEILKVGRREQDAYRHYFVLSENIKFEDVEKNAEYLAVPDINNRITVMVDYHSPLLGTQHASIYNIGEFEKEIASSRTFVFLRELFGLAKKGLIKGGDVDNAIVLVDSLPTEQEKKDLLKALQREVEIPAELGIGIVNNVKLRFDNEPARHKLLDIMGDLALLGVPIKAHILAARPGHLSNVKFAKCLKAQILKQKKQAPKVDLNKTPVFNIEQVKEILPHRYPFLLVDKIMEIKKDDYVIGIKNVTTNEEFFNGHFPKDTVMPGVLIIESMAQIGGFLVLAHLEKYKDYSTYFLKIENVRFKQKVVPGDTLVIKVDLLSPIKRGISHVKGTAYVGNKIVTEAELYAHTSKK